MHALYANYVWPEILQNRLYVMLYLPGREETMSSVFANNKVSKGTKIRTRYNQVPHLTQDTNGKVTNSKLDTTNESQMVSPFPAGDHKAQINRRAQRHNKHKTTKKHK